MTNVPDRDAQDYESASVKFRLQLPRYEGGRMSVPLSFPECVVVDENGAYWREFGDHYSRCPVSDDNEPAHPVAVYVPEWRLDAEKDERRSLEEQYEGEKARAKWLQSVVDEAEATEQRLKEQLESHRQRKNPMPDSSPHSDLPPVSYEALEANNRHTHANLNACIEQRQRLEEQTEALRAVADHHIAEAERSEKHAEERDQYAQQLEEQLEALYEAVRLLPRPDLRSGSPYADGVRNNDLAVIWRAMDSISKRDEQDPASSRYGHEMGTPYDPAAGKAFEPFPAKEAEGRL